jgi:hypothetical protein
MSFTLEDKVRWDNLSPSLKAKFKDIIIQEILNYLNNADLEKLLGGLSYKNLPPKIGTADDTKLEFKTVNGDKELAKPKIKKGIEINENTHGTINPHRNVYALGSSNGDLYLYSDYYGYSANNYSKFVIKTRFMDNGNIYDGFNKFDYNISCLQKDYVFLYKQDNEDIIYLAEFDRDNINSISPTPNIIKTFNRKLFIPDTYYPYVHSNAKFYYDKDTKSLIVLYEDTTAHKFTVSIYDDNLALVKTIPLDFSTTDRRANFNPVMAVDTRRNTINIVVCSMLPNSVDAGETNPTGQVIDGFKTSVCIIKYDDMNKLCTDASYVPKIYYSKKLNDRLFVNPDYINNSEIQINSYAYSKTFIYDDKADKYYISGYVRVGTISTGGYYSGQGHILIKMTPSNDMDLLKTDPYKYLFSNITTHKYHYHKLGYFNLDKTDVVTNSVPIGIYTSSGPIMAYNRNINNKYMPCMYFPYKSYMSPTPIIPNYMISFNTSNPDLCNITGNVNKVVSSTVKYIILDVANKGIPEYHLVSTEYIGIRINEYTNITSIFNTIKSDGTIINSDNIDFTYIEKYKMWLAIVAFSKPSNDVEYKLYVIDGETMNGGIVSKHTYTTKSNKTVCNNSTRIMYNGDTNILFIASIVHDTTNTYYCLDMHTNLDLSNKTAFIDGILNKSDKLVDRDNGWFLSKKNIPGSFSMVYDGSGDRYTLCFLPENTKAPIIRTVYGVIPSKINTWEYFNDNPTLTEYVYFDPASNYKGLDVTSDPNLKKAKASIGEGHVFLGGRYSWFKGKKDIELTTDCINYVYLSRKNKADDVTVEAFDKALLKVSNPIRSNKPYSDPAMFETVLIGTVEVKGNQVTNVVPYPIGDNYLYLNFDITH